MRTSLIIILISFILFTQALIGNRDTGWKKLVQKGLQAHSMKKIPRMRFYFRQACARALLDRRWQGVYHVFDRLLANKTPIPAYFFRYLKQAMKMGEIENDPPVFRLLGSIWLKSGQKKTATAYFLKGYNKCLTDRQLTEAARLSDWLIKSGKRNEGIANLVHCARTARVVMQFIPCFISADYLEKNGVRTAAVFWYNQAAHIALKKNDNKSLARTIQALRLIGSKEDADWWDKRAAHDKK